MTTSTWSNHVKDDPHIFTKLEGYSNAAVIFDSSDSSPSLAKGFWLGEITSNQTINRLTGGVPS